MSHRFSVTVDDDAYAQVMNMCRREKLSQSEASRRLIQEALSLHVTTENIDFITSIMNEQVQAAMMPYMERLIKLTSKTCIQAGTAAYLNAETLSQFVPLQQQQDFYEAYEKARKRAVAYIKNKD